MYLDQILDHQNYLSSSCDNHAYDDNTQSQNHSFSQKSRGFLRLQIWKKVYNLPPVTSQLKLSKEPKWNIGALEDKSSPFKSLIIGVLGNSKTKETLN